MFCKNLLLAFSRKLLCLLTLLAFVLAFSEPMRAQITNCSYTLKMKDSFGDGWNGAFLIIRVANSVDTFTLDNITDSGDSLTVSIAVTTGDTIKLNYTSGNFPTETSYKFFDADGISIFSAGPSPASGNVFSTVANCPSCPIPGSASASKVRAYTTQITWSSAGQPGPYLVFYKDTAAAAIQNIIQTPDTIVTLVGLTENTVYNCRVARLCTNLTDTSSLTPAIRFKTFRQNDVGIVGITTPKTGCGLTNDEIITVRIKNFGIAPQSLIPLFFSVDGVIVSGGQPDDGLYTGVVGRDSIATFQFDAKANLAIPKTYLIKAWTKLDGDTAAANDTATVSVSTIASIANLPYFIDFENGAGSWHVDSSSTAPSWKLGTPAKATIKTAVSGTKVWTTSLTGTYNIGEQSYLVSPCFDFTNVAQTPNISFYLNYVSEQPSDGLWLEGSKNSGATWTKIGAPNLGISWYNNAFGGVGTAWSGNSNGWRYAAYSLAGFAGQDSCQFRFVCKTSSFSSQREGFAIDNIALNAPYAKDMLATSVQRLNTSDCGVSQDTVRLTIYNLGSTAQTAFNVRYRVNNQPVVTENVDTLSVAPQSSKVFTFATPFNSATLGAYTIKAWTALAGEQNPQNDTAVLSFVNGRSVPFTENFEGLTSLPLGWKEPTNDASVGLGHGSISSVLYDNLFSSDTKFQPTSPLIGVIKPTDSLTFDFRFVNFSSNSATQLGLLDTLFVEVSTDCGATFNKIFTIKQSNHTPTTTMKRIRLSLAPYAGQAVKIRFNAVWGSGDYYIDIDNINVLKYCVPTVIAGVVTNANVGLNNGAVAVSLTGGVAPFTYKWSNSATTRDLTNLAAGEYCITVTDSEGCIFTKCFTVTTITSLRESDNLSLLQLLPNPTSGVSQLQLAFRQPVAQLNIQLTDVGGRVLLSELRRQVTTENMDIDLSSFAAGLYFVRVVADGEWHTEKLVLMK